jgi:hypothetical protein
MEIPDPLTDPSSIADPSPGNPPQNPIQPDSSQSNLPQVTPGNWGELEWGYGQDSVTIAPEEWQPLDGIGTTPLENGFLDNAPSQFGLDSGLVLNFKL